MEWKPRSGLAHIAKLISRFGEIYNGFEAHGVENIPLDRPALLVFYHGLIPLDAWYFGLKFYLDTGVMIRGLGDRWLFRTPGMKWLVETVGGVPGDPVHALELLRSGNLVGVSPGGVREAIKGDVNRYKLVWGNRQGFARLALEAGVDVIPVFSENVDELYRAPYAEKKFFQNLYEKTKLPLVPILGLGVMPFPVKLRVWVGKPITIQEGETAETLVNRTREALLHLIQDHQPQNQTVVKAILERLKS